MLLIPVHIEIQVNAFSTHHNKPIYGTNKQKIEKSKKSKKVKNSHPKLK